MNLRNDKLKDRWDSTNLSFERDIGFTWPQRNYPCSFCKKHFKSAQALGGHMNVHRRERAQLRQSPSSWQSPDHFNFNPNPNPNTNPNPKPSFLSLSSSSPATRLIPHVSYHSSLTPSLLALSSQSSTSADEEKMFLKLHSDQSQLDPARNRCGDLRKKLGNGDFLGVRKLKSFRQEDESRVLKKEGKIGRLELGMGLLRDAEEDLDLELRLGFS
ncbi:hypothetical protein U1Q18_020305 [Sarracenia purpurea var. burkii]